MNFIRKLVPFIVAGAFASQLQAAAPADSRKVAALLDTYCQGCHNATDWAGGLALDVLDLGQIPAEAKSWEQVARKLRGRMMPPPTEKQPTQANIDQLVASWRAASMAEAAKHPAPGFISLHRLNRTEYERAVQDILGVQFDAAALLPKEVRNEGFDNVANILKVSPSFLDQYLWAAREVSVGDPKSSRPGTTYRPGPDDGRMWVPGMPLGTRGGVIATHDFPVDGEYTFNVGAGGGRVWWRTRWWSSGWRCTRCSAGCQRFECHGAAHRRRAGVGQRTRASAIAAAARGIKVNVKAGVRKVVVAQPAAVITEGDEMLKSSAPAADAAAVAASSRSWRRQRQSPTGAARNAQPQGRSSSAGRRASRMKRHVRSASSAGSRVMPPPSRH